MFAFSEFLQNSLNRFLLYDSVLYLQQQYDDSKMMTIPIISIANILSSNLALSNYLLIFTQILLSLVVPHLNCRQSIDYFNFFAYFIILAMHWVAGYFSLFYHTQFYFHTLNSQRIYTEIRLLKSKID